MTLNNVMDDIIESVKSKYNQFEIDQARLEEAVSDLDKRSGGQIDKLPELVKVFIDSQSRGPEFVDIINFCDMLNRANDSVKIDGMHKLYCNKIKVKDLNPLDFINILEGNNRSISLGKIGNLYEFPRDRHPQIPSNRNLLAEDQKRIMTHWNRGDSSIKGAYLFLIKKQIETGSFREWLEKQQVTRDISKEFKDLGLDYSKWDNPKQAFGCSNNKLEKIVLSEDDVKDNVRQLTREMTRGKFTGYLNTTPKALWNTIEPVYKSFNNGDEGMLEELLKALSKNIKPQHLTDNSEISRQLKVIESLCSGEAGGSSHKHYTLIFKVWRRQPSFDFCEGNAAGVCTGIGSSNQFAMPNYIVDKAVSLVDIHRKGTHYGQIYYVAMYQPSIGNKSGVLMLDSIEASECSEIDDVKNTMYQGVLDVTIELAKQAGFSKVLVNDHVYHRYAPGFRNFVENKTGRSRDGIKLTKIGNMAPISLFDRDVSHESRHYFDAGVDNSTSAGSCWSSDWKNKRLYGIVIDIK